MEDGKEIFSWWQEPCSNKEWKEFFPLLVESEVSLPLIWAGIPTANRPDRSRAAGCLAALAAGAATTTGGLHGGSGPAKARALLATWCTRASQARPKDQFPAEDREGD